MTEREKMIKGMLYDPSDAELSNQRNIARNVAKQFNDTMEEEVDKRKQLLKGLLGKLGDETEVYPDVKFDYGCNIFIGSHTYINFNATFLDCAEIHLGDNVFVGPNVSFLTPLHPMLASERNDRISEDGHYYKLEYAKPVAVGDNVWIGGNVTILPGVKIGHDSVIGAGSVVTKDVPPNSFAAGVPCRAIREITEADSIKYKPEIQAERIITEEV
ncbi:acetyltransferase [Enterocloster clostridioformis]|nr:acetyltransferase [Lachnoclostridium sp. YL32]NDO31202.1 sugar O-acetyltransferase [Enterocloster clostridioformis]OXE65449.1 acetyltransferase [Enterocloster clostridioformis]QQR04087.1 sugar O-acetyltransferase [Enterocloster clostridioformis]